MSGRIYVANAAGKLDQQYISLFRDQCQMDINSIRVISLAELDDFKSRKGNLLIIFSIGAARKYLGNDDVNEGQLVKHGNHTVLVLYDLGIAFYKGEDMLLSMIKTVYYKTAEWAYGEAPKDTTKYTFIRTITEMWDAIRHVKRRRRVSFDYETNGLLHYKQKDFTVRMFSFCCEHGTSYLLPIDIEGAGIDVYFAYQLLALWHTEIAEDPNIAKIGHNIKYDLHVSNVLGLGKFCGPIWDTMVLAHLVEMAGLYEYGLKFLTARYIPRLAHYADVLDDHVTVASIGTLAPYSATDPDATLRLLDRYIAFLFQYVPDFWTIIDYFRSLASPTTYVIYEMERTGICVDMAVLDSAIERSHKYLEERDKAMRSDPEFLAYDIARKHEERNKKIAELRQQVVEKEQQGKHIRKDGELTVAHKKLLDKIAQITTGEIEPVSPFNFASAKDLGDFFYTSDFGMRFPMPYVMDKGKGGGAYKPAVGKEQLLFLRTKSSVAAHLEVHRAIGKMCSVYLVGFKEYTDKLNRVRGNIRQTGTNTGRFSCSKPNVQTMPRGSAFPDEDIQDIGSVPKKMLVCPEGMVMIAADLTAAELRTMAELSKDPQMVKIFRDNLDPHAITAKAMASISDEDWAKLSKDKIKELRTKGKSMNFGLIYGMSAGGYRRYAKLSFGIELTKEEAEEAHSKFFDIYPGIKKYHTTAVKFAQKHGYAETLLGRRRKIKDAEAEDADDGGLAVRQAINTPNQGTGAEATQLIQVLLYSKLTEVLPQGSFYFFNQVHDSIMLYAKPEYAPMIYQAIYEIMGSLNETMANYFSGRCLHHVELKADVEISKTSWKDLEVYDGSEVCLD